MLEATDISFSYDGTQQILDHINITLKPGELVVITGPTGSGKSTLAKYLSGFIPRSIQGQLSGSLLIDGADVSDFPISEFSRKVALVQQDVESQLNTLLVEDEIAFGPENYLVERDDIRNLVSTSLASVGAEHLNKRPTFALSGGEKQRIVIASILACRPKYLILDEPSASLDPKGVQMLCQVLLTMKQMGLGIICIEHRLNAILAIADRALRISEGCISLYDINRPRSNPWVAGSSERLATGSPVLSADQVSFAYDENWAVTNASLTLHQGEIVALMGNNGSGKSTLVNLLGGILKPHKGSIYLDGTPLKTFSRRQITSDIAMVFQNPNHQIFERTVWKEQNLIYDVLDSEDEESIMRSENSLKTANLLDFKERNPFSLSHGQKRRLNISAVSVHEPRILLLDEPFLGQDARGRRFITQKIDKIAQKGGLVVVVTHDSSFAINHSNRIIFMEQGEVLLDGSPQLVLTRLETLGHDEYNNLEGEL
ncbi:MAG: ABC transporter ATP-binding protein [Candidatus Thorarchaeota archaeon]